MRLCFLLAFAGCASSEPAAMRKAGEGLAGHTARAWSSDVIFRCEPADCEVWLDGVPFGSCLDFSGDPKGLSLSEGMHKVEVKKAGFWSYETYVDSGGARAALTVKLSPH